MPKKTKTRRLGLFNCFRSSIEPIEQKELLISKPNTLNDLEVLTLEEVKQKIALIEKLEKTYEQQHLLALMKSIKNFSEKEKTFEKIAILKAMIAMYEGKRIDWSKFQPIPPAILTAPIQDAPKISLFQQQLQTQASKLKPVNKISIQEFVLKAKQGDDEELSELDKLYAPKISLFQQQLQTQASKLKPVNKISIQKLALEELSELDEQLAKRKAISEQSIFNNDNACNPKELLKLNVNGLSKEEELDNFEFWEQVCNAPGFVNDEFDCCPSRFKIALSKILENTPFMDELDELLKSLQEFVDKPEEAESSQTLSSMHFNSANNANREPVIVEEILKPNLKR